ncbi:hypothetical protein HU200_010674 [Digitaria exilis]|uniref:Uncharacterized protein n=1 Tax=Digitaria exilis TaxID=1010633 RepID=A0A835KND5_9POAL|nr:hypothetical protein HU200_010674 [Digitaria exilis]
MLCLGLSGCQQQGAHPSALDYFLAVLVVVTAVAAARLLACAVARCLFGDDGPAAAAAHHHHDDHSSSPSTSDDVDEDAVGPWEPPGCQSLVTQATATACRRHRHGLAEQDGRGLRRRRRRDGARAPRRSPQPTDTTHFICTPSKSNDAIFAAALLPLPLCFLRVI